MIYNCKYINMVSMHQNMKFFVLIILKKKVLNHYVDVFLMTPFRFLHPNLLLYLNTCVFGLDLVNPTRTILDYYNKIGVRFLFKLIMII